jgi:hypothetical protein
MPEWLTEEYERLKQAEYERIRARFPTLVTRGFECWTGWFPIIERFFDEVADTLDGAPNVRFDLIQVKEKFAGLCIYYRVNPPKPGNYLDTREFRAADAPWQIDMAYERARKKAATTCEVCGQPGVFRNNKGFFATRCDTHVDGGEPSAWDRVTG